MHAPVRVEVARPATTAANITQEIIEVPNNDWAKRETLRRLINEHQVKNAIVFCNRKRDVDVVAKSLAKHGFNAAPLHGDLDQSVRTRTLDSFRSGELALLVASDVAARGLDIPAVSHIFNFDVPFHADDYVHRIGRTGRAGRSGHAFMLASSRDAKYVEAIEKLTGTKLARRKIEGVEVREDMPRNNDRNRGHDRNRGRNQHRERPRPDHGQRASMEPAQQVLAKAPVAHTPEPLPVQHQPKPHKQDRRQDHRQKQQQKPQPQHAEPKKPDAHQLPAFLLRPINVPKAPEKPAPRAKKKSEDVDA